jgi:hypothetical protein
MKESLNFKVGDSVVVRPNVKDPDSGVDIGGWQGRISEVERDLVCIRWDSATLKNTPSSAISKCEEDGLDWTQMYLEAREVQLTTPRDTEKDVAEVIERLRGEHAWEGLGEEGRRIRAVLSGVDPDDDWGAFEAWAAHLRKELRFPFDARVSEFQERGPLREGDRVTALEITGLDGLYCVLVEIKHEGRTYQFPLCDLEAIDRKSPNYRRLKDYAIWFANH